MLTQIKHTRPWTRQDYPSIPRNPIRVVSWNHAEVNMAGIIRSGEAFRIEHVHFFRKPHPMSPAVKTERWQPWSVSHDLCEVILQARADGFTIVALEQTDGSIPLLTAELPEKMLLVAGDEGTGVPPKALGLCDMALAIPQHGMGGSLNVNVAVSIALYEWTRQHTPAD